MLHKLTKFKKFKRFTTDSQVHTSNKFRFFFRGGRNSYF